VEVKLNSSLELGNCLEQTSAEHLVLGPAKYGLQWHQPGAASRQLTHDQARTSLPFGPAIVGSNPVPSSLLGMPRCLVPDEDDETQTILSAMGHQRFQELDRFFTVRLPCGPAQERFLALII
jgi:hypothetical protein